MPTTRSTRLTPPPRTAARWLVLRVLLVLAGVLLGGASAGCARESPTPSAARPVSAPAEVAAPVVPEAVAVLGAWDAARAEAWARGDPALLRRLYVPGSRAGERDRAMLRAWVARGLRVRGLSTQLLSVRSVRRTHASWTLVVTDRVAAGRVVVRGSLRGRGPGAPRSLPAGAPSTRTVVLRRVEGGWRVASVRRAPAGGAVAEVSPLG